MKGYSPLRRWLRQERAREHQQAIAFDVESVRWRPSRASAVEIASRLWQVDRLAFPVYMGIDMGVPGSDRTVYLRGVGSPSVSELLDPGGPREWLAPWQDVTAGDETVFATGGAVKPEPFLVRDIRAAVESLRRENRGLFIPAHPNSPLAEMGYSGIEIPPGRNER